MNHDPKNTIIINKFVHVPWLGQRYESTFMNRLNTKNKNIPENYNYKLFTQDNNNYNQKLNLECFDTNYSCPKRVQILLLVLLVILLVLLASRAS